MREILGQYTNKNTIIHKLDPRLKIVFIMLFSSFLIPVNEPIKILFMSLLIALLVTVSKIPMLHLIRSIKAFVFLYLFILIMYLVFAREMIFYGILSMWKFILLICLSLILTATTTLSSLVKGIEWILSPLRMVRINPKNLALLLSATIRFIPHFFLYSGRIRDAMISRLSDFRRMSNLKIFVSRLISRMIASASTLSDGIESRCYKENNTISTEFKSLRLAKRDYTAIAASCIVALVYFLV